MKFRVMIVKKNGQPVGVRAGAINGRTIVLGFRDELEQMNWHDAVNKALVRAGGEPLKKSWYWSSSEISSIYAWYSYLNGSYGLLTSTKDYNLYVRPVLAL